MTFIAVILVAAPLRLQAYAQLGKNFTFRLEKLDGIVRRGMYAYVRHPSYMTFVMIMMGNFFFWLRLDGVVSCFLPAAVMRIEG